MNNILPIEKYKNEIINLVLNNKISIITGDTGSGKSTKLPQILFDSNKLKEHFNIDELNIIITQPRRMAAISMAKRVSEERNLELFTKVSYSIRFDNRINSNTKIRYLTDGILVRELLYDNEINKYNIIILDEAHERSIYTDILFAILKTKIENISNIRLIITSATLNINKFSHYFNNAPFLEIEGTSFPVEIFYHNNSINNRIQEIITIALKIHLHEGIGDILCFLTGSEECELSVKYCINKMDDIKKSGRKLPGAAVFALYGAKNSFDQNMVFSCFNNKNIRKIIFSTNISETSLTIPNIGYVIDCGYVKVKSYSSKTGIDLLSVECISKTQAIQRAGRAGRTQEGKCYRLYSKDFYDNQMDKEIQPEITRINLSNLILSLKMMGINNIIDFNFMDKPEEKRILKGLEILLKLNALNLKGEITKLGKLISKFPIEPNYGKIILLSKLFKKDNHIIKIISILSSENIWKKISKTNINDYEKQLKIKYKYSYKNNDLISYIKIFDDFKYSNYSKEFCEKYYFNYRGLITSKNIYNQLSIILKSINIKRKYFKNDIIYDDYIKNKLYKDISEKYLINICFYSGFFYNLCKKINKYDYMIVKEGKKVYLDENTCFIINNYYPDYLIFLNHIGDNVSIGKIKNLFEIDNKILIRENNIKFNKEILLGKKTEIINEIKNDPIVELNKKINLKENKIKLAKEKLKKRKLLN